MTDDGAWPSRYKLTLGSGELKLIATWHSLTPDTARSGVGWGACWQQCFVFEQDISISVELVSTQEAAALGCLFTTQTYKQIPLQLYISFL